MLILPAESDFNSSKKLDLAPSDFLPKISSMKPPLAARAAGFSIFPRISSPSSKSKLILLGFSPPPRGAASGGGGVSATVEALAGGDLTGVDVFDSTNFSSSLAVFPATGLPAPRNSSCISRDLAARSCWGPVPALTDGGGGADSGWVRKL